jgi:pyruvate/2-oxoglutarate dehydrogenase complex dihydrolipoamide dehydrogenase (E3) component
MAIDYDLVVLGMGSYAHELVLAATKLESRVAWICDQDIRSTHLNIAQTRQVCSILKNNLQKYPRDKRREVFYREIIPILNRFDRQELLENIQIADVDVIFGKWQFHELSQSKYKDLPLLEIRDFDKNNFLGQSNSRKLKSRAYAIANDCPSSSSSTTNFADLPEHNYLTVNQLLSLEDLPESVTLIGDDAYTCEIAQAVNFLGVKTTLIANHHHILPNVDVAIARTLQAQLEIEGIEIYTQTKVTAIEPIANERLKIWMDNQILECDRLLLLTNYKVEQFPSHPHIYACNSDLDVQKIINKTLQTSFWKSPESSKSNIKNNIAYVETTPPIAQVGTMQVFNLDNVLVLESSSKLGLCKVICDRQGHIVGASMLGDQSKLVIEAMNIAMQGKVKVQDIGMEDLQLKEQWQAIQHSKRDRSRLRDWFTFRRDWNI